MDVELANYLIGLDKYIVQKNNIVNTFSMDIRFPISARLELYTLGDSEQSFLIDIKESEKKLLKLSLHHQDNSTQNGLLRVDYNSRHQNPVEIIPTLPKIFIPYAGQWLDNYPGHIHSVVNGYKPLAWAIPLEVDDFPVKKLNGREDYISALRAFFHKINLKTIIKFNNVINFHT